MRHYRNNRRDERVEPIATDDDAYEAYEEQMKQEEDYRREHPRPTKQYDYPIGPQRPPSFREKVESKAHDIKENVKELPGKVYERVKHEIGEIKRKHKENVEYEEEVERQERKVKSSPEYIQKKAEHELYMSELRARNQRPSSSGRNVNTKSATVTMGGYRSAYSGRSTAPRGSGFGGSYMPAYTGQMWGSEPRHIVRQPSRQVVSQPVRKVVKQPSRPVSTIKRETPRIHMFGGGEMPKIGSFGSSMPKIGGGGKKIETIKIGSGLLGSVPKIGKSITHKGSPKSINIKTNIGIMGEVPKIGFGLKKKTTKRKTKRSRKK